MKQFYFILMMVLISSRVSAQTDELTTSPNAEIFTDDNKTLPDPKVTLEFDIRAAFPTGEFETFYPKPGMGGFGATVLFPIDKRNPLDVGFGLGYYFMSQSRETFQYYAPGVGDYDVESRVSGGMFSFHLTSRIYPLKAVKSPFQPYIEGLAGFRVFGANQRLETYIYATDTYLPIEKDYNYNGSWSYGFGGGLKVMVSRNELISINAKVTQLYGTSTKNMDPSTVEIYDDGTYKYNEFKSRTDVLRFSFGIQVMIE